MHIRSAEILCVGTEILIGDIVNTNAAYLSARLAAMGIDQYYQSVVGDNPARLEDCIRAALCRCDLLIMTGGLGPTYDDLTKETAARCMGRALYMHEHSRERLCAYFSGRGIPMTDNNLKQAMMPEGAVVFDNDNGTAPALAIEDEAQNKLIVMLPGPPSEMVPLFGDRVEPYLRRFTDHILVSRNVNIVGMGESAVEAQLASLMKQAKNPTVAPYCKEGEVRLRVTASAPTAEEGERLCQEMIGTIRSTPVGRFIYGCDTTLPEALVALLKKNGLRLSTAESCTGGLIAQTLTGVPGASEVFDGGVVSYSESVKASLLGVRTETLSRFGAVSAATAKEMACGVRTLMGADYALSVTGFAGPGGGTAADPVGTVYIGCATPYGCDVRRFQFKGNREKVRQWACVNALSMALSTIRSQIKRR